LLFPTGIILVVLNQNPEQRARDKIDTQLAEAGWLVQDAKKIDFSAGLSTCCLHSVSAIVGKRQDSKTKHLPLLFQQARIAALSVFLSVYLNSWFSYTDIIAENQPDRLHVRGNYP
jgi:hypothetical protein